MSKTVLIKKEVYSYPDKESLFRPSEAYPEYPFAQELSRTENPVYDMVRQGLRMMGLDRENFGKPEWDPLGAFVKPGNTVLIKPNMVMDVNPNGEGTECLYTQPPVVAAVADYVIIALHGTGKIIIGDAPMQECNFENLLETSGYGSLLEFYKQHCSGIEISIEDFREVRSKTSCGVHYQDELDVQNGREVELGEYSEFYGDAEDKLDRLRITNYNPEFMKQMHNTRRNVYYASNALLQADVVINMPKPKTHRKAGVTIALKNMVGICARKEYLPHHTLGSPAEGGDEYLHQMKTKALEDRLLDERNKAVWYKQYGKAKLIHWTFRAVHIMTKLCQKDAYREGSWYGNDTISRTIADLNKIVSYADKNGVIRSTPQRKSFVVADMIISGEKEGPLIPSPKKVGIIAMGDDPAGFDKTVAAIMGADISKLAFLRRAFSPKGGLHIADETEPELISNDERWNGKTLDTLGEDGILHYIPTEGWKEAFVNE